MKIRKKAAIELSLSFIVTILIALVVFAGGIYFIRNLFSEAQETQAMLDRQTADEIKSLLAGGEILAVPISQKTIRIGKQDIFWVAIANVLFNETNFYVTVGFDKAYTSDGLYPLHKTELQREAAQGYINENWLLYDGGPHKIEINDNKPVSVLVSAQPEMSEGGLRTKAGLYAFNVCVSYKNTNIGKITCGNNPTLIENVLYPDRRPRRFIVEVK